MRRILLTGFFALATAILAMGQIHSSVSGTVKDQNGDLVAGATVTLRNTNIRTSRTITTDRDGNFFFGGVSPGEYSVRVLATGFSVVERPVKVTPANTISANVTLEVGESRLTVSAEIGQAEEAQNVAQAVSIIGTEAISERATSVLAQVGEEEAGLNVQRTSPTIGAVVVRGLT
ncbi:MAG: beta-sandwich domain-containing protein, partial [Pyrinomonadaceae bacterium]